MSAEPAVAPPSFEVRGDVLREVELVTGWCFSPDRPRERLRVGLYVDDVLQGSTVAARYRGDLVQDGVCDGYHGFSLPLPRRLTSTGLIELREHQTGHAFGRLLPAERADVKAWAAQIAALESDAATMTSFAPPTAVTHRLAEAFARVGRAIAPTIDPACARIASLQLPHVATPRISLVLCASWGLHGLVAAALLRLAPLLGSLEAELLICDDGEHPFSSAFANIGHCQHLRLDETARTDLLGVALPRARAPRIAFLDPATVDAEGLATLLPALQDNERVIAGGAVGTLLADIHEELAAAARGSSFYDGVLLATSPAMLVHHERLEDTPRGIVYRLADRALVAHLAGATLQLARRRAAVSALIGYETLDAEHAFARRWQQTRRGRLLRYRRGLTP